jgi:hypothetical protein
VRELASALGSRGAERMSCRKANVVMEDGFSSLFIDRTPHRIPRAFAPISN